MGRKGRPRNAGKRRYPNGRIKKPPPDPNAEPSRIKGNDRIEAMREKWGTFYNSALGRAYASGLLGEGQEALGRYQAARKFVKLHARFYGAPGYTCPLDQAPRGHDNDPYPDIEANRKQLAWLNAACDSMDVAGVRKYFDELVSPVNVDSGPAWLSILLANGTDPRCYAALNAAIRALDIIAPEVRPVGILAVVS